MIDRGEKPFVKPFMVRMADDHYALDIKRAVDLLGWRPHHRLKEELPRMAAALKADPVGWYRAHRMTPPPFVAEAAARGEHPEKLRMEDLASSREEHRQSRWAHLVNVALGTWLITQPALIDVSEEWLARSEMACGAALIALALVALPRGVAWARWAAAAIGAVIMALPFLFWTTNAAAYLSDTLVGMLVFGLAVGMKPEPGPSAIASLRGPEIPPGWNYNPSAWSQRLPIIALAFVGFYIARYLAGYQLGHIPNVCKPVFRRVCERSQERHGGNYHFGSIQGLASLGRRRRRLHLCPRDPDRDSRLARALAHHAVARDPVRTDDCPAWDRFDLFRDHPAHSDRHVVDLGADWRGRRADPDSLFARRTLGGLRFRAPPRQGRGQCCARALPRGRGRRRHARARFRVQRGVGSFVRDMLSGGVSLPWNYAAAALIGVMLLFTRPLLGAAGVLANADHVIGALVLTTVSIAVAEVARPARFCNMLLGAALVATPFVAGADAAAIAIRFVLAAALIALSIRRGPVRGSYGAWSRYIV